MIVGGPYNSGILAQPNIARGETRYDYLAAPADVPALVARLDQMISIRQSFLDEQGIARPATFSWTRFGKSDETLEAGRDRSGAFAPAELSLGAFCGGVPGTPLPLPA